MKKAPDLTSLEWPQDRWADALRALARAADVADVDGDGSKPRFAEMLRQLDATMTFAEALPDRARAAGLDVQPIDFPAVDPLATLRRVAPAMITSSDRGGFLIALRVRGGITTLIGPDGPVQVPSWAIEDVLWGQLKRDGEADVARDSHLSLLFREIDSIPPRRRSAAGRVLLAPSLTGRPLGEGWSVRPITTGIKDGLRAAKIHRRFAGVVAAYVVQFALFLAIWSQVGTRVLAADDALGSAPAPGVGGFMDGSLGFTAGFMILLGLWAVIQLAASAMVSRLTLDMGAAVRAGLMRGALRLDPGSIRTAGVGQLLGRAMDAEVLDALALGGGVEAAAGIFELLLGAGILAVGATPAGSLAILVLVLGAIAGVALLHARRLTVWCHTRRALTHDLVERMIGHRTALIQDRPGRRAVADAEALHAYDLETRALDRAEVSLSVALPRGWLLAGLLAVAPLVFLSSEVSIPAIAASLAGVWLIYGALRRLGGALPMLSLAREAWGQIAPLVGGAESDRLDHGAGEVAKTVSIPPPVAIAAPVAVPKPGDAKADRPVPLVELDAVAYQYPERPARVLDGVSLKIAAGDRVLVEGASGGGKSTLAGLLTGLKNPVAGHLRLRGMDQSAIGLVRWRRAVGGAPQFHDNHVIGSELLFNLLMGRRWPPRVDDIAAAERVCQDLGLGPLIKRMPAGIVQVVGETGWQLSHGERSRLFIARSLLQILDARVLDESFAALDPETLDEVLGAVLARPEALIVIAHP